MHAMLLIVTMVLAPLMSEARCRSIQESASLGSEYGAFPLYPAEQLIKAGQARDSVAMQWAGYGIGVPLFILSIPVGMAGAGVGAVLHPWTKCNESEGRLMLEDVRPIRLQQSAREGSSEE